MRGKTLMAKRIYEFICTGEENHLFEKYTDESNRTIVCPHCGELSNRIVSPVRCELEPFSGAYPGAYWAWNRKRAEKIKQERKNS